MALAGLIRQKKCWVLTFRGWMVLLIVLFGAVYMVGTNAYPFLAQHHPIPAQLLVAEGWLPDYALQAAIEEFKRGQYRILATTGGPLARGYLFSTYKTYPDLATATLKALGMPADHIRSVPAPPAGKNRTYVSALALKKWIDANEGPITSMNVISLGPHARRSRLLFQKALGNNIQVGVIRIHGIEYEANRWWSSSNGIRSMIGESIAFIYARFFFNPHG